MDSILIIDTHELLQDKIIKRLKETYDIKITKYIEDAPDMVEDVFFDTFILVGKNFCEKIKKFLEFFYMDRSVLTPAIFISNMIDDKLKIETFNYRQLKIMDLSLKYDNLIENIENSIQISNILNERTFTMKVGKSYYDYEVKNLIMVERSRPKHIKLHYYDTIIHKVLEYEYYYEHSLASFAKRMDIKKGIIQGHRGWLINLSNVESVDFKNLEIKLKHKKKAPLGDIYIDNFKIFKKNRR